MKNRAKCRLCNAIIESFHQGDYVSCICGEISVYEGSAMRCAAKNDLNNILRIDDEGNIIIPKVITTIADNSKEENKESSEHIVTRHEQLITMLRAVKDMVNSYEKIPQHAMSMPATNYDLLSIWTLLESLLQLLSMPDDS